MKHTYEPKPGRGYMVIQESYIDPDERYAVATNLVGVGAEGLIEMGQWITGLGRDLIKQQKADAKAARKQR